MSRQKKFEEGEERACVYVCKVDSVCIWSQAESRAKQAERRAADVAERLSSAQEAAEATARGLEEQAGDREGLEAQLAAAQAQALRLSQAVREKEDELESLQVLPHLVVASFLTW